MSASATIPSESFFLRHEFAIRRLHSLTGIVPLGVYMIVHLTTNASLLNGSETFQRAVYMIHSPGNALPLIEWGLILLPLIFHAVVGVWIGLNGETNIQRYRLSGNRRYAWQRWTGYIAFVYLFVHVLHMHGWSHAHVWLGVIRPVGFGQFYPYNAASTVVASMEGWLWPTFYLVGVMACVYHLANGIWSAGITWGLWISPLAQKRALRISVVFGVLLAVVAAAAWWAAVWPGEAEIAEYREIENRMYDANERTGWISPNDEKRYFPEPTELAP